MSILKNRISILDSFRAIAILSVLLYHFFSLYFEGNAKRMLYPYNEQYNFFGYGYLGVQFFFIISGFVIFLTLENTQNFKEFWMKRMLRLWPSMLIASLSIYLFFGIFDSKILFEDGHDIKNFIPSLTFINPNIFNSVSKIFGQETTFRFLNGSFWTLWVEIQFYFLAGIIYFYNKTKFVRNFLAVSFGLLIFNTFLYTTNGSNIFNIPYPKSIAKFQREWLILGFNLIVYLQYFGTGIIFYLLYKDRNAHKKTNMYYWIALLLYFFFIIINLEFYEEKVLVIVMFLLFCMFIYQPETLLIFQNRFFVKTGQSSYFLYLIHEPIGLFLIYSFAAYFSPIEFVFPIFLIVFFILISLMYTKFIDVKITRWFKNKYFRK